MVKLRSIGFGVAALLWCAAWILLGCRVPPPGAPPGPISCTTEAVQKCWPVVLGPVNTCLTEDDAKACLLSLIQPTGCAVEGIVACLVRHEGAEFAHAAEINSADVRSRRAAQNARTWIAERGYTFTDAKP